MQGDGMADIERWREDEPPREGSIPGVPERPMVRRKDVPRLPLLEENERLCRQLAGAVDLLREARAMVPHADEPSDRRNGWCARADAILHHRGGQ